MQVADIFSIPVNLPGFIMSQTSVSRAHEQPSQLKDYEATLKDQALDSGNSKHPSDAEKAPVEPETPSLGWEAWSTVVAS